MAKADFVEKQLLQLTQNGPGQTIALFGSRSSHEIALNVAAALLESKKLDHPDLLIFHPQGKLALHSIEEMRRLGAEAKRTPHLAKKMVIIVEEADKMLPTSSNALLKTFEEPPTWCTIFLLTNRPDRLLPTILSRCKQFTLSETSSNERASFTQKAVDILDRGPTGDFFALKKELAEIVKEIEKKKDKLSKEEEGQEALHQSQDLHQLLDAILTWHRDLEANPHRAPRQRENHLPLEQVIKSIEETHLALERSNSLQNSLERLFLLLGF